MSTFTTPKGTVLPFLDLRGKPYLQVAHRLVWFREEHPDWAIETEITRLENNAALSRATIKDATGRIVATGHKYEDTKGFGDFIEKAETGSIGRALALCGYGTQFAPEFDEEDRIVDSPIARAKKEYYERFVTWAETMGLDPDAVRAKVKELFGKESSSQLSEAELVKLANALKEGTNEKPSAGVALPSNQRVHK